MVFICIAIVVIITAFITDEFAQVREIQYIHFSLFSFWYKAYQMQTHPMYFFK